MSALCHWTLLDHVGGVEAAVTDDQVGSPDRLYMVNYGVFTFVFTGSDLPY